MSNYNTQLQSNNTDLQTVLQTLQTKAAGNDPFANISPFTYTVSNISGAQYGFIKNSDGYYESQNKGQNNSYAICRVNLIVTKTCDITFDVINYAESSYDYALFGNLSKALALSYSADTNNVKENFKGKQSASIVNVTYSGVTAGNHFIDIKFVKDSSQHKNNDSVQFKLQEQGEPLSQETIDKILAADTDLVADNIKSGVNIFGVTGTYIGGDTSVEDGFITRTLSTYTNNRVSSITQYVFASMSNLKSVDFQNVKTIGSSAFAYCSELTSISFPACTTIESSAFYSCTKLTTASFPVCTFIGGNAFYYCSSLTTISFPVCTSIPYGAFQGCRNLTTASFPVCTFISGYAFHFCSKLTTASFPVCTSIGGNAFQNTSLTTASFPACASISGYAFYDCAKLTTASFPVCTFIGNHAFYQCRNLKSLYLTNSKVCTLSHSDAFYSTPIGGYSASAGTFGSIYVPASLLTSYKNATNWTYFSSRFVGI